MIACELWRSVYARREGGLEHLRPEMPEAWESALEAGDELRERFLAAPVEAVARWTRACRTLRGGDASDEEIAALYAAHLGIGPELLERATGADVAGLAADARGWMFCAPLADDLASEWAWAVAEQVRQLDNEAKQEGK